MKRMKRLINIQKSKMVCVVFVLIAFVFNLKTIANGEIYGSFIITNNGTSDIYTLSSSFNGANLGVLNSSTLILKGGQIKTWKDGTTDITGGKTYYVIYLKDASKGSFTPIALSWLSNNADGNPNNQIWEDKTKNIDIKTGLVAGKYYFEVYYEATANDGLKYDNNNSNTNNYRATFVITNENPPTDFSATKQNHQQIDLSWTPNATYNTTIVVARKGAAPNDLLIDSAYSVGNGDINTAGGKIIYKGTENGFSHTGLDASSAYYYKAFSVSNNYYSPVVSANTTTDVAPSTTITSNADSTLKEQNLDINRLTLTISNGTFVDAILDKSNFSLINAPEGLTIESVEYVSSTEAKVNLTFNGTDFDSDITDLKVQVLASELSCGTDLSTNTLSIIAINDNETLTLAWDSSIGTNGAELTIGSDAIIATLSGGAYVESAINKANITLSGIADSTIYLKNVIYIDKNHIKATLGTKGVDYDSDITLTLSISAVAIKTTSTPLTATINSIAEPNDIHKCFYGISNKTHVIGDSITYWINMEIGQTTWNATEIGYGKGNDPANYTWTNSEWYEDVTNSINKRVHAQIYIPATKDTGTYYIIGRVKALPTAVWCYMSDNNWSHSFNVFTPTYCIRVNKVPEQTLKSTSKLDKDIIVNWSNNSNYKNVMIVSKKGSAPTNLTNGTNYPLNSGDINEEGKIIYKGSDTSFVHNNLDASSSYYYKIYTDNKNYYSQALTTNATTKNNQIITFQAINDRMLAEGNFILSATSSSLLVVSFSSSDTTIVAINGSTAIVKGVGEVIFTASQKGDDIYNSAIPITQKVKIISSTTINSLISSDIKEYFYPNIVENELNIVGENDKYICYIYDVNGILRCNNEVIDKKIIVSQLNNGIYFIKIISDKNTYFGKFIKK